MNTVRSLRRRRTVAEAAAALLQHGLMLMPVIRCEDCELSLPADHQCRTTNPRKESQP